MRKLVIVILFAAVGAVSYHFLQQPAAIAQGAPGEMPAVPVSVAEVVERNVVQWDEFSGRLEAVDRVEIRPRVAGTIEAIHFEEGQLVQKGDLLFTIDQKPYEAAHQAAKARSIFAQADLARARDLLPRKVISQQQFDDKRSTAAVEAANLTRAELDLGYTQIRSPIAGRVSRAEITVGNLVNSGGDAPILTRVVSIDPIYADVEVDEQSFVRYLRAYGGNPEALKNVPVQLALSGEEGFSHEGHIKSFDNELNTRAGTVRVRAEFANPNAALIPGLFAHMRIGGSGKQMALLINEKALGTDQDKKFVNLVGEGNKVEYRVVTLGPVVENLRVVTSGLKAGERIVVGGLQRVRPGAVVVPQMVDMETTQAAAEQAPQAAQEQTEVP